MLRLIYGLKAMGYAGHVNNLVVAYRFFSPYIKFLYQNKSVEI